MAASSSSAEVLQGTLDLVILKALSLRPMHGWGVTQRVAQMTGDAMQLNPGSLYPALQRLLDRGWITARWDVTENNRRAKFYELTTAGKKQLGVETANWRRLVAVMDAVLRTV